MNEQSEALRRAMRHWTSGVSIVTSCFGEHRHGMTVNSLTSISLELPIVTVTLAHATRTYELVRQSGVAGITILAADQAHLSDVFAGRVPENGDRFVGVDTVTLTSGVPLLRGGLAMLDCRVIAEHALENSTLFLLEVMASLPGEEGGQPLVYFNRRYHRLYDELNSSHE